MGLIDKLSAGAERAAKEAEKAFDKGKAKVGELQLEMQMDSQAKKLGYLVFDFYRGRDVDQAERQKYLDELSRLEDQLNQARAEAAAKAEAAAAQKAAAAAAAAAPPAGDPMWQRGPAAEAAAPRAAAPSYPPVPPEQPVCDMPAQTSEAARESAERIAKDQEGWGRADA